MMRLTALWQRNVVGAVVTAAALGVLVAVDLGPQWSTYRHTVVPEHVVPSGQSGAADGQTWKVDSVRHLNRSPLNFGPPLPTGTVLTVITLDRSGPPADELCVGVITDGAQRWKAEGVGGFSSNPQRRCHQHVQQTGSASIRVRTSPRCGSHGRRRHRRRPDHGADAVVVSTVSRSRTCSRQ